MDIQRPQVRGETQADSLVEAEAWGDRFPVWTLLDVLVVAIFFILSLVFFWVLAVLIASGLPAFKAKPAAQILTDIRIGVLTQLSAYIATFWFVYRMIAKHYSVDFLEGIRWNWPGIRGVFYLLGGAILAMVVAGMETIIPMPSDVPMDRFFRTPSGVWILAAFAILLAPFVEEIFFRGLLFPALLNRYSKAVSVVVTASLFTLLHGIQLGWWWGPLLMIFVVGTVLTLVRLLFRSLASSVIVHFGYNFTVFVLAYVGSNGFRNLDKVVR